MCRALLCSLVFAVSPFGSEAPQEVTPDMPVPTVLVPEVATDWKAAMDQPATELGTAAVAAAPVEVILEPALGPVVESSDQSDPSSISKVAGLAEWADPSEMPGVEAVPAAPAVPALTVEELVFAARESVAPLVDALTGRLTGVEQMVAEQARVRLEVHRESMRTLVWVVGVVVMAILLAGLLAAVILARALRRVSEVVIAALPADRQLTAETPVLALAGDSAVDELPSSAVGRRFLGAMEKLERRITDLEHTASGLAPTEDSEPAVKGGGVSNGTNGGPYEFSVSALSRKQYGEPEGQVGPAPDPAALWLGKGQALLNLGLAGEAVECFERAASLNPARAADAYLRRGMALENLQQMEAAVESYDRALAADPKLTLAYLYKGAVCNRLQRYREALDCYDSALECERQAG